MAHQDVLRETTIVDADVHLTVPSDALVPYVDRRYRDLVRTGRVFPNPSTWDSTLGGAIEYLERADGFVDAPAVEAFCAEYGIDHPIVNTNHTLNVFADDGLSTALMRAYNDHLLDQVLDETDAVYGLASLSTAEPEATAEEIDRLAGEGAIAGGYISNNGMNPPPGDPRYDPIYRALEDADLPVVFHANADASVYDFGTQMNGFQQYLEGHSVAHLWYQTMAISSLVCQGTPEKFPDLDFVILEAGLSWVPYSMFRLNREVSMRRREAPLLERSPEEYIRDQFYFASQPMAEANDPGHMGQLIDIVGAESLLFASDYPHWDFDHPDALASHIDRQFSADERRQVLAENPQAAFRL